MAKPIFTKGLFHGESFYSVSIAWWIVNSQEAVPVRLDEVEMGDAILRAYLLKKRLGALEQLGPVFF